MDMTLAVATSVSTTDGQRILLEILSTLNVVQIVENHDGTPFFMAAEVLAQKYLFQGELVDIAKSNTVNDAPKFGNTWAYNRPVASPTSLPSLVGYIVPSYHDLLHDLETDQVLCPLFQREFRMSVSCTANSWIRDTVQRSNLEHASISFFERTRRFTRRQRALFQIIIIIIFTSPCLVLSDLAIMFSEFVDSRPEKARAVIQAQSRSNGTSSKRVDSGVAIRTSCTNVLHIYRSRLMSLLRTQTSELAIVITPSNTPILLILSSFFIALFGRTPVIHCDR
ncbi:hypothetical protein F5050DRAFT_1019866 [Lentinula boryana]|uniref:Uncharacterized protein n=1 Tax=Lentinula boryana TaxID=40481 RepID=A0ABQ8Q038_9AGAR|nr:hypothetical protein F5050DRAFT_1019866 [Lentinula boryana]